MTNFKTLAIAALAALTLGAGAAQAQNMVPGNEEAYYFGRNVAPNAAVPSGSSDVATSRSILGGANRTMPIPQGHLEGGDGGAG